MALFTHCSLTAAHHPLQQNCIIPPSPADLHHFELVAAQSERRCAYDANVMPKVAQELQLRLKSNYIGSGASSEILQEVKEDMTTAMRGSIKLVLPAFAIVTCRASTHSLNRHRLFLCHFRCCSSSSSSAPNKFEPSDVLQLAEKARITLTPKEVEDFRPKLEHLVGWFGQLQEVDLDNITPALRADNISQLPLREDVPSPFEDRGAILAAVPETEGPYVKVPKILNESME